MRLMTAEEYWFMISGQDRYGFALGKDCINCVGLTDMEFLLGGLTCLINLFTGIMISHMMSSHHLGG